MDQTNKETADKNKQQPQFKNCVANEILKILADNNLTISEADDVLRIVTHNLRQQKIRYSF